MDTNTVQVTQMILDKISPAIDAIAQKTQVAAEHIWWVLTKQGIAEAVSCLVWAIGVFILALIMWGLIKRARERTGKDENGNDRDPSGDWAMANFIFWILFLICLLVCTGLLSYGIKLAINPEYFAIQTILNALGGVKQ